MESYGRVNPGYALRPRLSQVRVRWSVLLLQVHRHMPTNGTLTESPLAKCHPVSARFAVGLKTEQHPYLGSTFHLSDLLETGLDALMLLVARRTGCQLRELLVSVRGRVRCFFQVHFSTKPDEAPSNLIDVLANGLSSNWLCGHSGYTPRRHRGCPYAATAALPVKCHPHPADKISTF